MGAGNGESVVHSIAGSGKGVGLGEGAMVFEVFFAAAGKGGMVCCCSGKDVSCTLWESGQGGGGLLGEGGEEAEVLGLVGKIYVCRVGRRPDCGIFVDVGHDGGEGIKVGATK